MVLLFMSYVQKRETMIKPIIIIGFLSLAAAFNSNAHDSDELEELEKEILEIKQPLSELESPSINPGNTENTVNSSEGWKSISNWRKLTVGMEPSDVRQILGEPHRIKGGQLAFWDYPNGARVTFMGGKIQSWSEPLK
jgi:hypothetical protein